MDESTGRSPDAGAGAAADLLPLVYDQLRSLARRRLDQERVGHTLQATALVHEAYLRLSADGTGRFDSRGHFYAAAAEAMRRILIEHARARGRIKRAGPRRPGGPPTWANVLDLAVLPDVEDVLAFDDAIGRLESDIPLAATVVRLRFYAGLTVAEVAELLGVSERTVNREWAYARAWLFRVFEDGG